MKAVMVFALFLVLLFVAAVFSGFNQNDHSQCLRKRVNFCQCSCCVSGPGTNLSCYHVGDWRNVHIQTHVDEDITFIGSVSREGDLKIYEDSVLIFKDGKWRRYE